ncbi:MAG: HDOD domain-containing protein [Candidatus Zixiibacteriota bacterium]
MSEMTNQKTAILEKIKNTQPLSYSAMKLMEIIAEEDHSIQDILKIVESDSILTANILKVVNSASFGLMSEIDSISRAVAYVGDKVIVGMAIASCSGDIYNHPLEGYSAETRAILWKHSLKTAIASREIANYAFKKISREVAYTAGILHDIGKAMISDYLGGVKPVILEVLKNQKVSDYLKVEYETIGTTHCETGHELAKHWKLPEVYQDVINYHHYPYKASEKHRDMAYVVHLGDMVAMMGGTGTGIDTLQYQLDKDYDNFVSIGAEEIERMILDVEEDFQKTSEALFIE